MVRGTLCCRIEFPDRFQTVAVKLDAKRPRIAGWKKIDDPAAAAEIAPLLDERNVLEPPVHQMFEQRLTRHILALDQINVGILESLLGNDLLHECRGR